MERSREEKLLHTSPGSRIEAAKEFGIDLTLLVENLRLTPAQRLRSNDQAVNDLKRFETAMRKAKQKTLRNSNK